MPCVMVRRELKRRGKGEGEYLEIKEECESSFLVAFFLFSSCVTCVMPLQWERDSRLKRVEKGRERDEEREAEIERMGEWQRGKDTQRQTGIKRGGVYEEEIQRKRLNTK